MAGLKTIIGLAFVLAIGFLFVILSCALYNNWWPLLVVATYVLAPLPNEIFGRCSEEHGSELWNDEYAIYISLEYLLQLLINFDNSDNSSSFTDAGRFITGILIVTGFCLPFVLAHAEVITVPAMIMSIIGGVLVYGTIGSRIFPFNEAAFITGDCIARLS
ncbi:vacuolar protein sorting 55-domain-containing protein [Phycomyces blakesleeanus]|uniref:Vacuolar protein sorting 55-domain-containing protein n=1 Tax=Phycomyces blakesleeanus TaxID=4837 RepID=A0ABR3B2A8_PHYBL